MRRVVFILSMAILVSVGTAFAQQPGARDQTTARTIVGSEVAIAPVTVWSEKVPEPPAPPAVVVLKIKPRRARLLLDGRPIGLATDFDGSPDYLYLKPGSYEIEVQLGGYQTEVVLIEATSSHRYDVVLRLPRRHGEKKEPWWWTRPRPRNLKRLYEPVGSELVSAEVESKKGADVNLRPDLDKKTKPKGGGR